MTNLHETLPSLLVHQARTRAESIAFREKAFGIWQPTTWAEYLRRVRAFALGLRALGLEHGDRVAIVGDNRPEWVIAQLSTQAMGAVSIGVYQDSVAEELRFLLAFASARFVVAEDQEQVDKVLEIQDHLPTLQGIIYHDPRGLGGYDDKLLLAFADVEERGRELAREQPSLFDDELARLSGNDVAVLSTTSGTTGKPKLAILTHANLLAAARSFHQADPMTPDDEFVSFLPLAWIGEQMLSISCGLQVGFTLNFPEEPETVRKDLVEIGPQTLFAPPRIWENMVSEVQVKIEDTSALKRLICNWALGVGDNMAELDRRGDEISPLLRFQNACAEAMCFFWIKDKLGLRRLRRAYTGGAALGPDVFRFFRALGVPFKQIYGQTEVAGMSSAHRDGDVKFLTVGRPLPGTEIQIAADGEILTRGPSVFQGYYENPKATAETLRDGWLYSGDAGYFDEDGHLVVIDRKKDVVTLPDGTTFSPQFLENKLKFSPYVRDAVVFGEGGVVTAILVVDFANTGKWAERRHLAYTTFTDLSQKEEVYNLLDEHVAATNRDLPESARVSRFLLLHKELDADDAELTRTRKVRRGFLAERYRELVEALVGDAAEVVVKTEITYQDGRSAEIETRIRVRTL
jgi:long-chain acyl-CoA synthetase